MKTKKLMDSAPMYSAEYAAQAGQDGAAQTGAADLEANRVAGMFIADAIIRLQDEDRENRRQAESDADQADETKNLAQVKKEQKRAAERACEADVEQRPVRPGARAANPSGCGQS